MKVRIYDTTNPLGEFDEVEVEPRDLEMLGGLGGPTLWVGGEPFLAERIDHIEIHYRFRTAEELGPPPPYTSKG